MPVVDCHREMTRFHSEKVTLSNTDQGAMRTRRDAGRTRLENGLNVSKQEQPYEIKSQGSYQMRTMVQDVDNDYDIDDGAYFKADALKDQKGNFLTPKAARERVCGALKWDGRLKNEATVKKNCVRQEYPEGYHIDVPVYRLRDDTLELASGDNWIESDAQAVTRWFNDKVGELNIGDNDGSQLRRIVKLTKKFSRRNNWKSQTTSGIAITKLVVDCFTQKNERDDQALRVTWQKIHSALGVSTEIKHPVVNTNIAESDDKEVGFFKECLAGALNKLVILESPNLKRKEAREAWGEVFDTTYFVDLPDNNNLSDSSASNSLFSVTSTDTARRNDGGGRFG